MPTKKKSTLEEVFETNENMNPEKDASPSEKSSNASSSEDSTLKEDNAKEVKGKTEKKQQASADAPAENPNESNTQNTEPSVEKPKRSRKKAPTSEPKTEFESISDSLPPKKEKSESDTGIKVESENTLPKKTVRKRAMDDSILTIETRADIETQETREDIIWHEIHNAYRTRRIMTGILSGVEQTENGKSLAVVDYKDSRIIIPLKEMMINLQRNPSGQEYSDLMTRQNKILSNMLGAEIDFIVKGIDSKTRTAVASRKDAMLKKRQLFYLTPGSEGMFRIYEGRIVQARVIAVAEKIVRVEVFGVECSVMARDMSWEWVGDAHERYSVGDEVLVRVLEIQRDSLEEITIKVDAKSVTENTSQENLRKCRVQSKYVGAVTDVRKGVVFIRLVE